MHLFRRHPAAARLGIPRFASVNFSARIEQGFSRRHPAARAENLRTFPRFASVIIRVNNSTTSMFHGYLLSLLTTSSFFTLFDASENV